MSKHYERAADERINWYRSIPFILMHLAPFAIIWTGFGWEDALLCAALYFVRMFFITAGYHRYFGHRSYKLGRVMQFIMAFGGGTAAQKGALWWAAHHRHHHKHSDDEHDIHSPMRGFWWSHMGWITCDKYHETPLDQIKDFAQYPELRFLDRHHLLPPTLLALFCALIGGWSGLVGGFFLSTVLTYHGTFVINSMTHVWGSRRYVTTDTSRNNMILALITLGEGWHNNHHYYQRATCQGFYWWEIDVTFYILKLMSWVGLAHGLHVPPERVRESNKIAQDNPDIGMIEAGLVQPMTAE
jgi:stearoyl-CoA desaturase (delta-9 desaturase)